MVVATVRVNLEATVRMDLDGSQFFSDWVYLNAIYTPTYSITRYLF